MIKYLIALALGVAMMLGALVLLKEEREALAHPQATLNITFVAPQSGRMTESLSVIGAIMPREEVRAMTELAAVRVRDVLVEVGDLVKKGQVLAVLDGQSQANQLAQFKSDYEQARDTFTRADALKDSGAISRQLLSEKLSALKTARARLDEAELNLKRSAVLAPEDGVIFERTAVIGALVSPSEPLFRLARRAEVEMEALVPEAVVSRLRIGLPATIKLSGSSEPTFGKIRLITPKVDTASRMVAIRIELLDTAAVSVGLFATASIQLAEHDGLLLPKTALQQDSDGDFVWILTAENRVERRALRVILRNGDKMMIDAIPQDSRVVARAGAFLKEGELVQVTREP